LVTVASTPGLFGSFYRTSLQLTNPSPGTETGRLVFHTRETSGSDADPSIPYTLAPGQTRQYDDVLAALGLKSGNGSLDVVPATGDAPVARARVYNDAGAAGTTGVTEDALPQKDALVSGDMSVLLAPANLQKFRFSIGVRTLSPGATVTFTLRDANGATLK